MKNENESLKQRVIDSNESATEEASMEERYQNSAIDDTEERMSYSSIITSACVAYTYHSVADRNPSPASDSDSVVYAVPFHTC